MYFHIGVGSGVALPTKLGNARAFDSGNEQRVQFPRFFYAVSMNLQSACPGNCRHNMFGRHEYRDAVFMGS